MSVFIQKVINKENYDILHVFRKDDKNLDIQLEYRKAVPATSINCTNYQTITCKKYENHNKTYKLRSSKID